MHSQVLVAEMRLYAAQMNVNMSKCELNEGECVCCWLGEFIMTPWGKKHRLWNNFKKGVQALVLVSSSLNLEHQQVYAVPENLPSSYGWPFYMQMPVPFRVLECPWLKVIIRGTWGRTKDVKLNECIRVRVYWECFGAMDMRRPW